MSIFHKLNYGTAIIFKLFTVACVKVALLEVIERKKAILLFTLTATVAIITAYIINSFRF